MKYVGNLRDFGQRGLNSGWSSLNGFQKFLLRGNVVDLAVGIVIGAAFNNVIQALVTDLITPFIGIFGNFNFPEWSPSVGKSVFQVGAFLNVLISFIIVSLVVYFFVVRPINALTERFERPGPAQEEPVTTRDCPFCLSSVPLKAMRCAFCTAQLPPASDAEIQAAL